MLLSYLSTFINNILNLILNGSILVYSPCIEGHLLFQRSLRLNGSVYGCHLRCVDKKITQRQDVAYLRIPLVDYFQCSEWWYRLDRADILLPQLMVGMSQKGSSHTVPLH